MRFRLRYLKYIISLLIMLGFIVWLFVRPTVLEMAKDKLSEARSYGEIKGVWQQYEEDLVDNPEWKNVIEQKLSATGLNDKQKQDLKTWLPEEEQIASLTSVERPAEKPDAVKTESVKQNAVKTASEKQDAVKMESKENGVKAPVGSGISSIEESNKSLSKKELAELYNKQGDEKCQAFKAANAPHLYHIANEYYEYAASLTNSEPKVCE
ncbi:hypothetical protein FEM33_19925 [Dyadobacter flavalbus]|uniref:Uncharacterized protein n=1 Tax=Dyadobacter flavalbus TaxID=2579942 RepID=A0A5M8QR68_9BACT|nr:hypothetical protein [Dyadobacter flavalbus]KAA6436993.1 hypothetical protein FEM33_19925 [Dyadobacter flavalbus]